MLFRNLHHICFVVHDIDASMAYFESVGVGPWQEYPPLTDYAGDLDVPNPDAFFAMKYRVVDLGNVQLQLCQPPDLDCPQRRFLDTRGEGVFHLGFENDLDAAQSEAAELGLDVIMRGRRENGSGFVYFDTLDRAGTVLMNRKTVPPYERT
jgi:methylmalonyl-CoA/ethylmalonyl-CoA epimerase